MQDLVKKMLLSEGFKIAKSNKELDCFIAVKQENGREKSIFVELSRDGTSANLDCFD